MRRLASLFSSAIVALLVPGFVYAGDSCDSYCGKIDAEAKAALANPTCAKDPNCTKCVQSAQLSSQSGIQCSAAVASKKGKAGETIYAAVNTAATILCGTACTMSMIPGVGTATERGWSQACGWAGFGVTAAEVGYTIANVIKGEKVDYLGLATKAFGVKSSIAMVSKAGEKAGTEVAKAAGEKAAGKIATTACLNAVMYGIAAASKIKSMKKDSDMAKSACENAQKYATPAGSPVQACLAPTLAKNNVTQSTQLSGMFSATAEVYAKATIDDVNHLAATSALNDSLKDLKRDMDMAAGQGKLDYDGITKKLEAGADLSSILADANLNPDLMNAIKNAEDAVKNGDTTALNAAMGQGGSGTPGYSAPSALASTGGESGIGDLSFGASASPGEGAESLEIDRAPAGANASLAEDGDIFHGAFGGTIFDIVTTRLKAEKSNYAELDPEGRMNRLFNGFGDPGAKTRTPAGRKAAK